MNKLKLTLILFLSFSLLAFANTSSLNQEKPKIGDVLVISENNAGHYKHIKLPRKNILIKRGVIPSYESVSGAEVKISEIKENKYGKVHVKLVRTDGKKFFNKIKSISATYQKAIDSGELLKK
ncbi:MAG: hypothetical protein KJN66_07440 [Bacteroidia bacterium]|nr:hypothetical protein [Bacteroidia bacterium]